MAPASSSEDEHEHHEGLGQERHSSHSWAGHYQSFSRTSSAQDTAHHDGEEAEGVSEVQRSVRRRLSNVPKLGVHSAVAQARWAKLRKEGRMSLFGRHKQERSSCSLWCMRLIKSKSFDRVVAAVVLMNGACTALDVDLSGDSFPRLKLSLGVMEHAFVLFFCAEAAAKALAFGPMAMLASRNYRFELLLAIVGAADLWLIDFRFVGLNIQEADFGLNVLPLLRVFRFAKVFMTGELHLISRCLFPAFGTLGHVALFLFIIIFMFSIPLARLVGQNPIWEDTPEVPAQFGTVTRCVLTLLQMVINPDTGIMRVLYERQAWTAPFFLIFVGMTTFTIMSIMFGSVTDCYKELRDNQKQKDGRAEHERRERIRADLLRELREADRKEVGMVNALSAREFKRQLQSPQFRGALQSLEVDQETVEDLIRLLEIDGGAVRYEEFVSALGLVGEPAKATHVLWLRAHLAEDLKRLEKRVEKVEGHFSNLASSMEGMEERLTKKLDAAIAALKKA